MSCGIMGGISEAAEIAKERGVSFTEAFEIWKAERGLTDSEAEAARTPKATSFSSGRADELA
jgi:hypothetical protein